PPGRRRAGRPGAEPGRRGRPGAGRRVRGRGLRRGAGRGGSCGLVYPNTPALARGPRDPRGPQPTRPAGEPVRRPRTPADAPLSAHRDLDVVDDFGPLGDGHLDLAVAGLGDGVRVAAVVVAGHANLVRLAAGDVDGDRFVADHLLDDVAGRAIGVRGVGGTPA